MAVPKMSIQEPPNPSVSNVEVSVICPMYNEAERIAANLRKLAEKMCGSNRSWEIILVNDGSTDDSYEQAMSAAASEPRIRVVTYRKNRGRGYALRRGFEVARGRYIVTTESDLSYGEDIIDCMVNYLETEDLDLVVASPYMKGGRLENIPVKRAMLSRFGNALLRNIMPGNLSTNTGMTRAYRRAVIESLYLEQDGKEIHLEIIAKAYALGFRMGEVPAVLRWDESRSQRKTSFRPWRLIHSHLMFGFNEYPLLLFGTVAAISALLGVAIGFHLFYLSLNGHPVSGRPLLFFSVLLILAGILALLFCFLSLQIRDLRRIIYRVQRDVRMGSRSGDNTEPKQ
jgi:glycosyltransferase involved in cell wall biosynthesis